VAAQVFVDDPAAPEVAPEDRHHLVRVLRLRPGELVVASDGRGGSVRCVYTGARTLLEPLGVLSRAERPTPLLTVAFAPVKGERPEWVVQKLTELGVDRIVPLATERVVVRWEGERAERTLERLRRIAREAAAQSRRVWLPEVEEPIDLAALVSAGTPVALGDPDGDPPSLAHPALAIGPEGGWSDAERALRLPTVALSDGVLRAETAAVAAGTLLAALRGSLVNPATATGHDRRGVASHRLVAE